MTNDSRGALDTFLTLLGLMDHHEALRAEGVDDVETLAELSEDDLKELGLKLGPRKKILKALREREADDAGLSRLTPQGRGGVTCREWGRHDRWLDWPGRAPGLTPSLDRCS